MELEMFRESLSPEERKKHDEAWMKKFNDLKRSDESRLRQAPEKNHTFNYEDYAKRYYDLDNKKSYSSPLKYYPYKKKKADFLFPKSEYYFFFNITKKRKKIAEEILLKKGFSNFKIIASFGNLEDCPVCIEKNTGRVVVFDSPFGNKGAQFINSTVEKFAKSLLYYKEFYEKYNSNLNNIISKRYAEIRGWDDDEIEEVFEIDSITADIVLEFLDKIENIDSGADKEENYWNSSLSSDISCHQGYKMTQLNLLPLKDESYIPTSIKEVPSILELPAWKVLHPRYSKKERYKLLAEKNPSLSNLREELDIEMDL